MSEKAYAADLSVSPKDIYYISWNIDACEGIGILETINAAEGHVTVYTTESMLPHLRDLIRGLCKEGVRIKINGIRSEEELCDEREVN